MPTKPKIIVHTTYECPICGSVYKHRDSAEMCAAQPRPDDGGIKPGDIVYCAAGFGWYDGDPAWISNPDVLDDGKRRAVCPNGDGNCFSSCCTYRFYYVVGVVEIEHGSYPLYILGTSKSDEEITQHRIRYHVFTKAMKEMYSSGYTHDCGHIRPVLVKPQPKLPGAKEFIGKRVTRLL